ncbi:MAG: hypothetical protein LBS81_06175 [Endomicrobium sp.]|nr:hypothetical protein [Endomicrobium sp.]
MKKIENDSNFIESRVIDNVKITFNNCLYRKELLSCFRSKILKAEQKKMHITNTELKNLKRKTIIEQFNYEKEVLNLSNAIGMELNTIVGISGNLQPIIKIWI